MNRFKLYCPSSLTTQKEEVLVDKRDCRVCICKRAKISFSVFCTASVWWYPRHISEFSFEF